MVQPHSKNGPYYFLGDRGFQGIQLSRCRLILGAQGSANPRELAMAKCEKLSACPFFNDRLSNMPAVASLLKESYCLGEKEKCARYRVSIAGLQVPLDLFPNDIHRAEHLLLQK